MSRRRRLLRLLAWMREPSRRPTLRRALVEVVAILALVVALFLILDAAGLEASRGVDTSPSIKPSAAFPQQYARAREE